MLIASWVSGIAGLYADQLTITMQAPHIHAFETLPIVFSVNDSQTGNGIKGLQPVIHMQKSGEDKRYEITLSSGELKDKGDGTYEWIRTFGGVGFYSLLFIVRTPDKDYSYRTFPLEITKAGGEKIFKPSLDDARYNYQVRWSATPYSPRPGDEVFFDIELKRTIGAIDLDKPWTNKFEHLIPEALKNGAPTVSIETGEGVQVKDLSSTAEYKGLGVYRVSMKFPNTDDSGDSGMSGMAGGQESNGSLYRLHVTFKDDAGYTVDETGDSYDFEVKKPNPNDTTAVKTTTVENMAGNFKVKLLFKDGKPKTGTNDLYVRLADAANMPVEKAIVTLTVEMDKGSSMSMDMTTVKPVSVRLEEAKDAKGEYRGKMDFGYTGSWIASVGIEAGGAKNDTSFNVEVASGGPNWLVIGIFVGILAVIILLAAIRKIRASGKPAAEGKTAA